MRNDNQLSSSQSDDPTYFDVGRAAGTSASTAPDKPHSKGRGDDHESKSRGSFIDYCEESDSSIQQEDAEDADSAPADWDGEVDYKYLTDHERDECYARLSSACSLWLDGKEVRFDDDLLPLAYDGLVRYAHRCTLQEQLEIGAPETHTGDSWLRHQGTSSGLASRSAQKFKHAVCVLAHQEEAVATRAVLDSTVEWWLQAKRGGGKFSVDSLIERSTTQLAVALMCRNPKRCLQESNMHWWTILARCVVTRLIMSKKSKWLSMEDYQEHVDAYVLRILVVFRKPADRFVYRSPGEAISYIRNICRFADMEAHNEEDDRKKEGLSPEQPLILHPNAAELQKTRIESSINSEMREEDEDFSEKWKLYREARAGDRRQLWEIICSAIGRQCGIKFWLLLLIRIDGFEKWSLVIDLLTQQECTIRYADCVPPETTLSDMDPSTWKMRFTETNLSTRWCEWRRSVAAELDRIELKFPECLNPPKKKKSRHD